MATVTAPKRIPFDRAKIQQRIRHPLQSLRGYIRSYIVLEGIAVAVLFVSVCWWAMLVLDYGLFELLMVDWVKTLDQLINPATAFVVRGAFLAAFVVCLIGLVAYMVLRRLFTEFSDQSLALVLERRFPTQLGDRLITAVELANPKISEEYGFSQAMVDHTIRNAAERVDRVPVSQVFNWRRLWGQWLLAVALSLGVVAGILTSFGALAPLSGSTYNSYFAGFTRSNSILAKRNMLLMNRVYWPTRSYIEIVRFQDEGHADIMKVGRDEQRPDVEARAFEYVIYDSTARDSIRPLRYADLSGYLAAEDLDIALPKDWGHWIMDVDDLDPAVSDTVIPDDWQGARAAKVREDLKGNLRGILQSVKISRSRTALSAVQDWLNWKTWTLDRIKLQLENKAVRQVMRKNFAQNKQAVTKLEDLFQKVDNLAASPWTNWNIRKLKLPGQVYVHYRGAQTKGFSPHEKRDENRYYIGLNELKESVHFYVQGENFFTQSKEIILVPPPSFTQLLVTKREPAYIYYWLKAKDDQQPWQEAQAPLKGRKQLFYRQPVSLTGSASRVTPPPLIGSDLEIIAIADREINSAIRIAPAEQPQVKGSVVPDVPVALQPDQKTFSVHLKNVDKTYEFEFRFTDLDGVKGKRHVIVDPVLDVDPQEAVEFALNGPLRKPRMKGITTRGSATGLLDSFLITPDALLPFKGTMQDDFGLTGMVWYYEYEVVDFELVSEQDLRDRKKDGEEPKKYVTGPARRAGYVASGFRNLPLPSTANWISPVNWAAMGALVKADLKVSQSEVKKGNEDMVEFGRRLKRLAARAILPDNLKNRLIGKAPKQILPKTHSLIDERGYDVGKWLSDRIKVTDPSKEAQLHYRLRVYMSAADNNIEAATPGYKLSKVPVTFLIVSETELLSQILIEEETLRAQLEKAIAKLKDAKTILEGEHKKLQGADPPLFTMDDRVKDNVLDPVQEKLNVSQEVLGSFQRILKEMEINRIGMRAVNAGDKIVFEPKREGNRVREVDDKIVRPLENIVRGNTGNFAVTEEAVAKLLDGINADLAFMAKEKDKTKVQQVLAANKADHLIKAENAQKKLTELIDKLDLVLEAIGSNVTWRRIIDQARQLEQDQRQRVVGPLRITYGRILLELQKQLEDLK